MSSWGCHNPLTGISIQVCAGCLHLPNIPSLWHLSSIQFLSKNKPKNNHVSRTWDLSILGTSKTLLDIVRIWYFSFAVVLWGLYLIVDQWLCWLGGNFLCGFWDLWCSLGSVGCSVSFCIWSLLSLTIYRLFDLVSFVGFYKDQIHLPHVLSFTAKSVSRL